MGDRQGNLLQALQLIRARAFIEEVSSCYETKPVGHLEQPDFLNMTCLVTTELSPQDLLFFLKQIERQMGRQTSFRNAPRPIDLDILFYDDLILESPELIIPHPRMSERAFVLVPLAEIAADIVHPVLKLTVAELLQRADKSGVSPTPLNLQIRLKRDVQQSVPHIPVGLGRAGVTGLQRILRITREGQEHLFYADIDLFADLDSQQMGVHMSRFSDALEEVAEEIVLTRSPSIETMAERIARQVIERQQGLRSEVHIRAIYPMAKTSPVSGKRTQELYTLIGMAVCTPERSKRIVGVEADGITACPCAQDMVREHSLQQLLGAGFSAEDLVRIVEASMSSETYDLLKRPDELFVVNKAHYNPRFVEDVVREMLQNVVDIYHSLPDDTFVMAKQINFESIHKHDAFAERSGTLGEIRGEIFGGQHVSRHTSLQAWLES
jgi:GTP cyclohydrolase-4